MDELSETVWIPDTGAPGIRGRFRAVLTAAAVFVTVAAIVISLGALLADSEPLDQLLGPAHGPGQGPGHGLAHAETAGTRML